MATKLPDGRDFKGTIAVVNSLTLNTINAQHYAPHLLPARMIFKGLLLTFIDEQSRKSSQDDEVAPPPDLEAFADALVAEFHGYPDKGATIPLKQWVSAKCTRNTSGTQLRQLASALLVAVLQDEEAARFGMMAVLDALCPYVTNQFGIPATSDALATAWAATGSILQSAA